jgi:hypothetical protein
MNHLTKSLTYIACASMLLIISSCKKLEFDKIVTGVWNPNLAVPLAHSKFSIYDILSLKDSTDLAVIDPINGSLALIYSEDINSFGAEAVVKIEDVNQNAELTLSDLNAIAVPAFSGTVTSTNNQTLLFAANGAEIHQVKVKSGTLTLNVSTTLAHDLTCVITFPEMKKNGTPVTKTVSLNYTGSLPQTTTATVDLTDALADYTMGNTTFNELETIISTTVTGTGQAISGTENISINFNFTDIRFKNAIGYFGQKNLGVRSDTILIKLFQNSANGYFELVNPKIRFIADNSFGFPIRVNLSNLKTVDLSNNTENPLIGYPTIFNIARPSIIGASANSQFELNTSNTNNLSSVISSVPKAFVFSIMAQSNPAGNVLPLNFITDSSKLKIRSEIELPMEGFVYGFEMKDTIDFSFNEDVSQLESVMFRLNVDNGFPVELKAKIVFLDQNKLPVFTIFNTPEALVQSALVNSAGRVNKRSKKITDILLTAPQIALLPNVKYVIINSFMETLNGTNGQVIKLYDEYSVDLKLGLQVQAKIQL